MCAPSANITKMSGSSQVIRATQMFTKDGHSKKVSLVREIISGFSLGLGFGLIWKVRWWESAPWIWTSAMPTSVALIGLSFGNGLTNSLPAQTYHWNEKRKIDEYYEELASLPDKQ